MRTATLISKAELESNGIQEICECHSIRINTCRVKKYVATESGKRAQREAAHKFQQSEKWVGRGYIKPKKELVTYGQAHWRVVCLRGKASSFECVDGCGGMATDWALKHDAANTFTELMRGKYLLTYALDAWSYEPKCHSCHLLADAAYRRASRGDCE